MWRQTVNVLHESDSSLYQVTSLCRLFGVTKQAYYKYDERGHFVRSTQESFVLEYVRGVRSLDPGMGCGKLWYMYRRDFDGNMSVGRDRFMEILDRHGLKVRRRIRRPRTTDSTHGLPTYPDLTRDLIPTGADQLRVSDITYVTMWPDDYTCVFCYLSLIMDAYSREIVGYSVGPILEAVYPLEALCMALRRIESRTDVRLTHHSDRGAQHASAKYIRTLAAHGISMTETGNPKDNAQAERINGTMKNELLNGCRFRDVSEVRMAVERAASFYNNHRPHMSIGMMTPRQAAACTGNLPMMWNSARRNAIKNRENCLDFQPNSLPLQPVPVPPSGRQRNGNKK